MLLDDVKNYLDITWDDPLTDEKLSGIMKRGMAYLEGVAGGPLPFDVEGQAKALLLDYCRYARSNALEQYTQNFKGDLLILRLSREVEDYAESTATGEV